VEISAEIVIMIINFEICKVTFFFFFSLVE